MPTNVGLKFFSCEITLKAKFYRNTYRYIEVLKMEVRLFKNKIKKIVTFE